MICYPWKIPVDWRCFLPLTLGGGAVLAEFTWYFKVHLLFIMQRNIERTLQILQILVRFLMRSYFNCFSWWTLGPIIAILNSIHLLDYFSFSLRNFVYWNKYCPLYATIIIFLSILTFSIIYLLILTYLRDLTDIRFGLEYNIWTLRLAH